MVLVDHEIDPGGDVILILRNPNAPFAVWDSSMDWPDALALAGTNQANDDHGDESSVKGWPDLFHGEEVTLVIPKEQDTPSPAAAEAQQERRPKSVSMRVSSRHLILASKYFKTALEGPWAKTTVGDATMRTVTEAEWGEESLLVLMNIIHGHHRKVPQVIDFELLARLATLVDYYDCHESVELFAPIWFANMSLETCQKDAVYRSIVDAPVSVTEYGRNAVLLLFASWVLKCPERFHEAVLAILWTARGPMNSLKLALPAKIVDKINVRRGLAVEVPMTALHKTLALLSKGQCICDTLWHMPPHLHPDDEFQCTALLLGAITRFMVKHDLLYRQSRVGLCVDLLEEKISNMDLPEPFHYRALDEILELPIAQFKSDSKHLIDAMFRERTQIS